MDELREAVYYTRISATKIILGGDYERARGGIIKRTDETLLFLSFRG